MTPDQFLKIVPQLKNPYALAGFALCLFSAAGLALLRTKPLSRPETARLIRTLLNRLFVLSLLAIIAVVWYGVYRSNNTKRNAQAQDAPVHQQAGDCSAVVNGSDNSTSVKCDNGVAK